MSEPGLQDLLQAGLHFGHQTRRWNPRMRRYIHGERDGIHIIDLLQTEHLLAEARRFAADVARQGGTILFVGTKKQARDSIKAWAERSGMPYVNQRWLGGLLTNFQTMSARIDRLHELTQRKRDGQLDLLPTKERMSMEAELEKLEYNLGGVRDMKRLPQAALIIDLKAEAIALAFAEPERLRIPILGLVDSNVDPAPVDFPIPGNDDSMRSCELVISTVGEAVAEAAGAYRAAEEKRRAEEEERRRAEEEAKRKREAEEQARREAEEAAAKAAEAQAAAQPQAEEPQQAPPQQQPQAEAPDAPAQSEGG
jgi:small subunit ribosomal protein S2